MAHDNNKLDKKNVKSSSSLQSIDQEEINFSVLTKFIKPYDGDRNKLSSFLRNCENALNLATGSQHNILFKFIISQLEGKADTACSLKIFDSWSELKQFLKSTFGETKHRDHLLLDLQSCKMKPNETVTQYSLRLETYLTRLQTDITHSNRDPLELKGRIASTEDLALHTFLLGLPGNISNMLRCRDPKTLQDAINLAIQEEKLQNYIQSNTKSTFKTDFKPKCKVCGKMGHSERSCFMNRNRPVNSFNNQPSTSSNSPNSPNSPNICRYCKFPGHDISQCRKRQFNNSRNNFTPNKSQRLNNITDMDNSDHFTYETNANCNSDLDNTLN